MARRPPARKRETKSDPAAPSAVELVAAAETAAEPAPPPPTPMPVPGRLFSVTRSQGSAWDPALDVEQQADWSAHAAFMNGLAAEGFIAVGGPLEETPYTMLAVRAENALQVRSRLADDPWEASRIIETTRIVGWTLKLGEGKI